MADIRQFGRMLLAPPWSKTHIEIIARFLQILNPIRMVNFLTLAYALSAPAQIEPNYKRLQRFFREIEPP